MHEIRITTGTIEMLATLNDAPTAERIWDALPIDSTVNTWGQEIYFSIPIQCDLGPEARDRMEIGEVAYWPTGSAFCVFFGKTPASKSDEPRAASPVSPIGRCEGDVKVFRQVREGDTIRLERIESEAVTPEPEAAEADTAEPAAETPAEPAAETPAEADEPQADAEAAESDAPAEVPETEAADESAEPDTPAADEPDTPADEPDTPADEGEGETKDA